MAKMWLGERGREDLIELLTAEEAAELLKVSPATIYRLMRSRELEVVRIGRCVRTSPQALQDYCARVQSQGK